MASGEELIDLSDDDDFEFKPTSNNDINCWGSNLLNDLEMINPIKEEISHVTESTNCVSELPCVDVVKTEDSDEKLNSESASMSSAEEIKAQLSISEGLQISPEETELVLEENADSKAEENLEAETSVVEIENEKKNALDEQLLKETQQHELQQRDEVVVCKTVLESVERRRPGPKSKTKVENSNNVNEQKETKTGSPDTSEIIDSGVKCASELREDLNEVRQLDEAVVADTVLESVERRRPGPKSKTNKLEISDNPNEPKITNLDSLNTSAMIDSDIKCTNELREDQNVVQQPDEAVVIDTVLEMPERRRPGPKSKINKLEINDHFNEPMKTNLDSPNTQDSGVKCASELREDQNEVAQLDEAVVVDTVLKSTERSRPGPKSKTKKLENAVTDGDVESELKEAPTEVQKLSETILCDTLVESVEKRRPGPKSKTSFDTLNNSDGVVKGSSEMKEAQNEVQLGTLVENVEKRRPGPKSKTSYDNSNNSGSSEMKETQNEVQHLALVESEKRRPGPRSKTSFGNSGGGIKGSSELKKAQNEVQKLSGTVACDTLVDGVERRRPGPKSKTIIKENGEKSTEPKKKDDKLSEALVNETRICNPNSSGSIVKNPLKEEQKKLSRPGPKSKTSNLNNGESDDSSKKRRKFLSPQFIDDSDSDDSNVASGGVRSSKKVKVESNEFPQVSETTACDTLFEKVERHRVGRPKSKKNLLENGENTDEPQKKKKKILSPKSVDETHFSSPNTSARMNSSGKGIKYVPTNLEIPLGLGWKREIVHRATFQGNKRMADVYYTSPKGKKLRSMNEVEQYLHLTGDTSVQLEMFSYYKQKLTDHENETERYAKKAERKSNAETLPDETPKINKLSKTKHLEATPTEVPHKHNKVEKKKKEKKSLSCSPSNNNNSSTDLNPYCNGFCEGYEGQLPDMNCVSCFCLFHPKCVGIFSSEEASDFICKNCLRNQSGGGIPNIKSAKSHHANTSENKLQTLKIKKHSHKTTEPHFSQVPSSVNRENNSHTPSSAGSVKKMLKTYERSVKSNASQTITLTPIRIVSPSSKAPNVSNLSPSLACVLPSPMQPIPGTSEIAEIKPDLEAMVDLSPDTVCAPLELKGNNNSNDYNYWTCTLPKEADGLANVFNYLHTKDLLHMKLVCSSWNAVASRPFLWNHLYLQGLMVTNWNLLADFIEAKNVVMLNMRGMKMSKDICEMWKQFNSIMPRLTNIKELMLCKIPASIPYRLASKLPNLTHIATEEIFDSKVDPNRGCKLFMGKFNKLTELRRLKLNGFKGLFIPKSIISDEFLNTDALKNLKHLSLTTFTGITSSQLESLSLLPDLTILELGNCSDWTDEHYLRIGLLTNLRKLRLEYGGTKESPVLCEVLKKLPELQTLELILFNLPQNFIQVLPGLKNLQLLTVWPNEENGAANSYRLTKALQTMGLLKKFVWGLVASQLVRDAAVQKQMDDKVLCIPYFAEKNVGKTKVKWSEDRICANDLMERLRLILPNTIIRVVIVSSKSYSSIRQASASK